MQNTGAWPIKQNVYTAKAKRMAAVLFLLSVFTIVFIIVEYPSQSEISTYPLTDAEVSPLKVRPGDTMLITASCVDPVGIETVTADMGGIETIQLSLISGTIYNGTWQATWLVHDTEVRDYNTTVTATNIFGESSSVNIVWSDPATEGMIAYGEGTSTTPVYRIWNGTGWESEQSANDVSGVPNLVVLRSARTRDEKILGVLDTSGHINVQVWNGSSWGTVLAVTTAVVDYDYRGFDIAYEDSSGDALIVYQNNVNDPLYRVWNGTGWSDATTLHLPTAGIPVWIRMASKPGSDEIIVMTLDTGGPNVSAAVWDGSAWGNSISLEGVAESYAYRGIAIAYESLSGHAMVAWSDGGETNGGPQYKFWDGSSWGAEAIAPATNDEPLFIELGSDPSSDNIVMGAIDSFKHINVNVWNGTGWGTTSKEVTTKAEPSEKKPMDVGFESTSGEALVVYSEHNSNELSYRTWNSTGWSGVLNGYTTTHDPQAIDMKPDPNSDNIRCQGVTDNSSLMSIKWNGSGFEGPQQLEDTLPAIFESFMFSYDRHFIISDVDADGDYGVGDTIPVTWNLTGSASATENYINVEYWDVTNGTQFDLKNHTTSANSSTSKALTDNEGGHTIAVYVYTSTSSDGNNSTAITQGTSWPYPIVNAVKSWQSYNDTDHNNQDDTFSGDEHTVYMHGEGFQVSHQYKVAYYDVNNDKVASELTNTSDGDGNLSSQYDFTGNTSATAGTWNSAVYDVNNSPLSTYNPNDPNNIVDDEFEVQESAIPEFPTVIAAIAVCMLCAVSYIVMRRNKYGKK